VTWVLLKKRRAVAEDHVLDHGFLVRKATDRAEWRARSHSHQLVPDLAALSHAST